MKFMAQDGKYSQNAKLSNFPGIFLTKIFRRKVIDASVDLICSIDLDAGQKVRLLPLLALSSDDVENDRCHIAVSILKTGLLASTLFPTLPSNGRY